MAHTVAAAHQKTAKGDPQKTKAAFYGFDMDLLRLVSFHPRIANAHIHALRIANPEERGPKGRLAHLFIPPRKSLAERVCFFLISLFCSD